MTVIVVPAGIALALLTARGSATFSSEGPAHAALAVFVFGEAVPTARLAGFVLVWCALALLLHDSTRRPTPAGDSGPVAPTEAQPVRG